MKVIDLLNKIANGEEVPKKIKYFDKTFYYNNFRADYLFIENKENEANREYLTDWLALSKDGLNDEVEILKEENKILEKLNLDTDKLRGKEVVRSIDYLIEDKINEIINYLEVNNGIMDKKSR